MFYMDLAVVREREIWPYPDFWDRLPQSHKTLEDEGESSGRYLSNHSYRESNYLLLEGFVTPICETPEPVRGGGIGY